jgi:hypothetical protein
MLTTPDANGHFLDADPAIFTRDVDERVIMFSHYLSSHPLFEWERLLRLARTMAKNPRDVYLNAGDVSIGQRWDEVPACDIPIHEIMHRIETAGAWIQLCRAEVDPEYKAILDACMEQVLDATGRDLRGKIKLRNAIVFINSPHRVSSYHIDRECNFLLQIRGHKMVHVFDKDDREVIPEEQIERFWTIDNNAATYNPALEHRAVVYDLPPGRGIHIPVGAPHWVQNGPEVSVSLSINFHYKDMVRADIYRANHLLRRLGLKPTPPFKSPVRDSIKSKLYGAYRSVRQAAGREIH